MQKLHLVNSGYLTNAATLLFAKDPQDFQQGAYIKIGYFASDADLLYQDEIHGSLLEQVDKALEVIYLKYMKAKISYEGIQRVERYFVPEAALREALLNAVCHKQYESCIPVQVSVYEDRLYGANVGVLPETWTLHNLLGKHESRPYNPNLATVLYYAGCIESWGREIEKIRTSCRADGLPEPEFTVHPGDIMIQCIAPEDRIARVHDSLDEKDQVYRSGYTVTQLSNELGFSRKTVAAHMRKLKAEHKIERVGSDQKGYWRIPKNQGYISSEPRAWKDKKGMTNER